MCSPGTRRCFTRRSRTSAASSPSSPRGKPRIVPRLGSRFGTMRMRGAFYLSVWPARSADSKRSGGARGDQYVEATLITDQVEAGIDSLSELAPLHNPACLAGIRGAREVLGSSVPMVAVFDTAFHQTMPNVAKQYALRGGTFPWAWTPNQRRCITAGSVCRCSRRRDVDCHRDGPLRARPTVISR